MDRHGVTTVAVLALATLVASGCNSLIPNYEVLPVPADSQYYMVGSRWDPDRGARLGPPDESAIVRTANGLGTLSTSDKQSLGVNLRVPIANWISGSVGLSSESVTDLGMEDLQHHFLHRPGDVTTTKAILAETVSASKFSLELKENLEGGLDVELATKKLQDALGSSSETDDNGQGVIEIEVSVRDESSYEVSASRRLVVAVRVAEVEMETQTLTATLDLTPASYGKRQEGPLSYTVKVHSADPVTESCVLRIENDRFPDWDGETVTLSRESPNWENPREEVIIDDKADLVDDPDRIWDQITVDWEYNLEHCKLRIRRQYLELESVDSGIQGTL